MKFPAAHRTCIALALYFCVLFNVLSCGLGHGQALGLALNGVGGVFCSLGGGSAPVQVKLDGESAVISPVNTFACLMCSMAFLSLMFLIGIAWLLSSASRLPFAREVRSQAPPRYCWPSANPRASPL
ncbi:DUF2946 domain-containing protein [Pseudomonas cichorii]|uniref:DUF2946 family protein n=1 Tax=Pseudomonas cichorii TaxID=36746 RepID=UPI001C8816B1|nr:DUF2946 family protein [Pseudomonas cichorii]MBX8486848.1 DUF2946 domain-containing protein [Pseudomonas cichorii]MBX8490886.1 DUF2946 domain-containing protein [Pseudomonas cichorii]MBX8509028.1 DUF2946 domain-containing protein [Pseudomonas cichorii]MBX8515616.1 DUF2946 domain-containing protein [Pseudomonas cichorii]MBX8518334.1 DUF2946 domain-containing protein [Pseudomonas cichorii]